MTSTGNAEFKKKKSFRMVFTMLLCGECYENVYTYRRTNINININIINNNNKY
jgi:hypothetical protein